MSRGIMSTFTPSIMTPEDLEAVFVQREDLAQRLVRDIRASATTKAKHHHVLVGPRGVGKTHLVSLVRHRVAKVKGIDKKLCVAWMREDEWAVNSYLDLVFRIRDVLQSETRLPAAMVAEQISNYGELETTRAEERVLADIASLQAGRTLLLIIENFDDILRALGEAGQAKLRAHLQNEATWTIVATSQSLSLDLQRQSAPFYGFFEVEELRSLDLEESVLLLAALARRAQDDELAAVLLTPTGRARVRALRHLAGGNHRVHVIFAGFLTRSSLADIAEPFLRTLDELTPYYQERMRWLSPQQRKLVETLADLREPTSVRRLATTCRISEQVASSQLNQLRQLGYVTSTESGRESLYDLRESLLRLCLDLKKQQSGTIRPLVDFLVIWCSMAELASALSNAKEQDAMFDVMHLEAAVHALRASDPIKDLLLHDLNATLEAAPTSDAWIAVAEELLAHGEVAVIPHLMFSKNVRRATARLEQLYSGSTHWRSQASSWRWVLALALVGVGKHSEGSRVLATLTDESDSALALLMWMDAMRGVDSNLKSPRSVPRDAQLAAISFVTLHLLTNVAKTDSGFKRWFQLLPSNSSLFASPFTTVAVCGYIDADAKMRSSLRMILGEALPKIPVADRAWARRGVSLVWDSMSDEERAASSLPKWARTELDPPKAKPARHRGQRKMTGRRR